MKNKLFNEVNKYLSTLTEYTHISVGLSGGRDSVVLLHATVAWFNQNNRSLDYLHATHINHGISEHSEAWTQFCAELCTRYNVAFTANYVSVDMNSKDGIEASARDARYEVFKKSPDGVLLLAQHKNDQAETFIFNIFRGCSVSSAGGMPQSREIRDGLTIYRPLLNVTRKDIEQYATEYNLSWVEDNSNTDTSYSRNFIRHDVLPLLETKFSSIENRLVSTAERFSEAGDLLDDLAAVDLQGHAPCFPLPVAVIAGLSERRARNLLRYMLNQHGLPSPAPAQMSQAIQQLIYAKIDRKPEIKLGTMKLIRLKKKICLVPV